MVKGNLWRALLAVLLLGVIASAAFTNTNHVTVLMTNVTGASALHRPVREQATELSVRHAKRHVGAARKQAARKRTPQEQGIRRKSLGRRTAAHGHGGRQPAARGHGGRGHAGHAGHTWHAGHAGRGRAGSGRGHPGHGHAGRGGHPGHGHAGRGRAGSGRGHPGRGHAGRGHAGRGGAGRGHTRAGRGHAGRGRRSAAVSFPRTLLIAAPAGPAPRALLPFLRVQIAQALITRPTHADPWFVHIPSIGVDARLEVLGPPDNENLPVPSLSAAFRVGWYNFTSVPGQPGNAVLVGHVDTYRGPAVFYDLYLLRPGEPIYIALAPHHYVRYFVRSVRELPKTRFPATQIFGDTRTRRLWVITCGGAFDYATRHYVDNIIVSASR